MRDHAYGEVGLRPRRVPGAPDAKFTKVAAHTFAGVFHQEAMQGSWRGVADSTQRVNS